MSISRSRVTNFISTCSQVISSGTEEFFVQSQSKQLITRFIICKVVSLSFCVLILYLKHVKLVGAAANFGQDP